MITLARFSIAEVLPYVGRRMPPKTYYVEGVPYKLRMSSLRYETFKRNLRCAGCGIEGNIFLLQYVPSGEKRPKHQIVCSDPNCQVCMLKLVGQEHRKPEGWESPHFNLYHVGENNGLVLMTKDHIHPKSKGGPDKIENLQTMCIYCNARKGNILPGEAEQG